MNEEGFIKNRKILEEFSREDNFLDLSAEIEFFSSKLEKSDESSLFGLVAKFGSGKTTFLNQIKKHLKDNKDIKWFDFDAWKYPERKDLWEAFVLEIAKQSGGEKIEKKIENKIKGRSNKSAYVDIVTSITSALSEKLEGINILDKFTEIFKKEPITRTYDFQNILKEIFTGLEESTLFIIVEDIDRSGDSGTYFLETLNNFLKNAGIPKKIVVIIPIGREKLENENIRTSYLKSIDFWHDFSLKEVKLEKFVSVLFDEKIISDKLLYKQTISFLEGVFQEFPEQMTMRLLKTTIRNANLNYINLVKKHGTSTDFRLVLMCEFAKNITRKDNEPFIKRWRETKSMGTSDSIFSSFSYCITQAQENIYFDDYSGGTKMVRLRNMDGWQEGIRFASFDINNSKDTIIYVGHHFGSDENVNGWYIHADLIA